MNNLADQIARFRNMAQEDPENDLAHYRLGQFLLEDGQFGEAVRSFRRTLEITPEFPLPCASSSPALESWILLFETIRFESEVPVARSQKIIELAPCRLISPDSSRWCATGTLSCIPA